MAELANKNGIVLEVKQNIMPEAKKTIVYSMFERVANGETITKVCEEKENPSFFTLWTWLNNDEELKSAYQLALQAQSHALASQTIDIIDNTEEEPASRNVRMKGRHWIASKLNPSIYGESTMLKHADNNGNKLQFTDYLTQLELNKE